MQINKDDNHIKILEVPCEEDHSTIDINDKLIFHLRNISHIMRALYEGKGSQKHILIILSEIGKITQRDLTEYLGIRPGSASEVISKLESAGYIIRSMSETDRRTMNIELSEKGKKAALEAVNQRKQRHKEMFSCLSNEDKDSLLSLLKTVNSDWDIRYHGRSFHGKGHGHCQRNHHAADHHRKNHYRIEEYHHDEE